MVCKSNLILSIQFGSTGVGNLESVSKMFLCEAVMYTDYYMSVSFVLIVALS